MPAVVTYKWANSSNPNKIDPLSVSSVENFDVRAAFVHTVRGSERSEE